MVHRAETVEECLQFAAHDVVTEAAHNRVCDLTLAQKARDDYEAVREERDALAARVLKLEKGIRRIADGDVMLKSNQQDYSIADVCVEYQQIARALLAKVPS